MDRAKSYTSIATGLQKLTVEPPGRRFTFLKAPSPPLSSGMGQVEFTDTHIEALRNVFAFVF